LLDLFLENAPLGVQRTGVLRVAFLPPEQTVIHSRLEVYRPQNIDEPDFRGWLGEHETTVMSLLSVEDTGCGQPPHDLGQERCRYINSLGQVPGPDSFGGLQACKVSHGSQGVFGWPTQVHLIKFPGVLLIATVSHNKGLDNPLSEVYFYIIDIKIY
jgi:hypothetical protein